MIHNTRSIVRVLVLGLLALAALDGAVWAGHVVWRDAKAAELTSLVHEIDALAEQIRVDDAWLESNSRLMQEYGQPARFAARIQERGRRTAAHRAFVDAYNRRMEALYRRFYWAPGDAPEPPLRTHPGGR